MNSVCLIGRVANDPVVRYSTGQNSVCVARYTIALDRPGAKEGQQKADFINVCALGKIGEFVEKYLRKGMKIGVKGRIQSGSYTNKEGNKVYTVEVLAEAHEFCEKKGESNASGYVQPEQPADSQHTPGGFMAIPDGVEDEGLPFN